MGYAAEIDVPEPVCGDEDLIVEIKAAAICGADMKHFRVENGSDSFNSIRGHEFHYWESEQCGESFHAKKPVGKRQWDCVNGNETLYAGFPHLFFWSAPEAAYTSLKKCEEYGTC